MGTPDKLSYPENRVSSDKIQATSGNYGKDISKNYIPFSYIVTFSI